MDNTWSAKYDSWSLKKSDLQLVEAVRKAIDPEDADVATRILWDRYQPKLWRFVHKALPLSEVEDVTQETWKAFWNYVRVKKIDRVSGLLFTIARNKRASEVDILTKERLFEADLALTELQSTGEKIEEEIVQKEYRQFLYQLPFTSLLSDCQRVAWTLRGLYGCPSQVVCRLLDKSVGTVDTHFFNANKKLRKHFQSEEYDLWLTAQELQAAPKDRDERELFFVVERFASHITPRFTPDELEPLGLTNAEFQANYGVSLILPGSRYETQLRQSVGTGQVYLTLIRKSELAKIKEITRWASEAAVEKEFRQWVERADDETERLNAGKSPVERQMGYEVAVVPFSDIWDTIIEEYLLRVDLDGENLVLTPLSSVELYPAWIPDEKLEPFGVPPSQVFISLHSSSRSPGRSIPICNLIWGEDGFTDPIDLEQTLSQEGINDHSGLREWLLAESTETSPGRMRRMGPRL